MTQPPPNPLLQPPFFQIPGIDPSSPISVQTEQIDQLNTLLLQEIDANFAKFHQIVTTRILPEIKRFAIAGEPTREAAKFWRSFFEAAAAVPIQLPSEITLTQSPSSHSHQASFADGSLANDSYLEQATADGSFMFQREGVVTSTPMAHGRHAGRPDNSWEQSMESPFDSVDRRLREDLRIGGAMSRNGHDAESTSGEVDMPTPSLPSGYSLPGLGKGYGSTVDGSAADFSLDLGATPKAIGKAKIGARQNPFGSPAPAASSSSAAAAPGGRWNGIADLRSTPLNAGKIARAPQGNEWMTAADDSDDELKFAMSPPVTMTFGTLPPRMQAAVKVSQTPRKAAVPPPTGAAGPSSQPPGVAKAEGGGEDVRRNSQARMILDDLMEEMERGYEPSPRMPTPEGLGRYSILPTDAAHGRNLFADLSAAGAAGNGPGTGREAAAGHRKSLANTSFGSDILQTSSRGIYTDEDSDLMDGDESYDTISGPSILGSGPGAGFGAGLGDGPAPAHAAELGAQYDDSFSVMESPPTSAAYYHTASDTGSGPGGEGASMVFGGPRRHGAEKDRAFELMRRDGEMETYFGGKLEDAAGDDVATSPTNAVRR